MHMRRYRKRKAKKILISVLILFLFSGIFYFLFFSQVFKINNFIISGGRSLVPEEVEETLRSFLNRRWFLIPANNFFILKEGELEKAILDKFKRIEGVDIQKGFPNALEVEIKEKNLNLIWCQKKQEERKCFYLDQDGMVFGKAFDIDLENLDREKLINGPFILVEEERESFSSLEEKIAVSELVDFIFQIKLILPKIAGLKMVKGSIGLASAGQINVETEEGWQVYFDTTRELTSQVKILDLVLTEKITKEERESLEYIDLRVPGRIYYK